MDSLPLQIKSILPALSAMENSGTAPWSGGAAGVEDWCLRIRAGDERAFSAFYDAYSRRVYALALSLARADEHFAREIHQTVMIRASRKLPALETEAQVWAWLAQVARHSFLDALRGESRRARRHAAASEPDAALAAESRAMECLDEALRGLPEEDRALVDAFYFARERQEMIAARRDSTVKAIQGRLARIRTRLRTIILKRMQSED